jgi:hypothetical protein
MSIAEGRSRRRGSWRVGLVGPVVVAVFVLAGCSGESESPDVVSTTAVAPVASPTAVAAAPTAEPTATVAAGAASTATEATATEAPAATATTAPAAATPLPEGAAALTVAAAPTPLPELSPVPPVSEVTYEQQKELLSTLVKEWYAGENNIGLSRLKLPPDVRDNRRGGILIHIEINGDEYGSTTLKKAELDKLMRDTYELLYTTGYEVTEVAITAIMTGVVRPIIGSVAEGRIQVFRSRLRGDAASTVDWANKESLDFNEIWETVLLNVLWKRELAAEAEAGE